VTIHNLREEQVRGILEELLATRTDVCKCDICRADMSVYALNRVSPKYVARSLGETMARLDSEQDQDRAQLAAQVARAIKAVAAKPRHG